MGDAAGITKAEYNAARDRAAAEYKTMRGRCDELSGNGKDVCVAEAKAFEAKRKAEAEASYRNSEKAVRNARLAAVDADYSVAKARCDARTGNEKSVCVAEATAARRKAKADAEAAAKMNEVRRDVAEEKSDADYKVALEKCNLLGGAAKDSCVSDAKARYSR
ncbi:MAG: hypothetical protein ABI920_11010 [Casimicrobiaceae bacterium]